MYNGALIKHNKPRGLKLLKNIKPKDWVDLNWILGVIDLIQIKINKPEECKTFLEKIQ